jgi:hypothetical protein
MKALVVHQPGGTDVLNMEMVPDPKARPKDVVIEDASIVSCAIGTILNAIRDVGHLEAGEGALVTGASGGLGEHAVQLGRVRAVQPRPALSEEHLDAEREQHPARSAPGLSGHGPPRAGQADRLQRGTPGGGPARARRGRPGADGRPSRAEALALATARAYRFDHLAGATALSTGYTVTGSPPCHWRTTTGAPARRPFLSNFTRPPAK